jgi:hypothetical protein
MPYYNFDLLIGEECKNQGGLILEDLDVASDRAEQLASETLCGDAGAEGQGVCRSGYRQRQQRTLSYAAQSDPSVDKTSSVTVGTDKRSDQLQAYVHWRASDCL